MKLVCTNSNIVFLFDKNINQLFDFDEIEEVITKATPEETHNFIKMSIDDTKNLYSTALNIQVVSQGVNLVVTSGKIHEADVYQDADFLRIAYLIKKSIESKEVNLRAVGFNFSFVTDTEDIENDLTVVRNKYFSEFMLEDDEKMRYILPNYSFTKGSVIYSFNYNSLVDETNKPERIGIGVNSHRSDQKYDGATGLQDMTDHFADDYIFLRKKVDV